MASRRCTLRSMRAPSNRRYAEQRRRGTRGDGLERGSKAPPTMRRAHGGAAYGGSQNSLLEGWRETDSNPRAPRKGTTVSTRPVRPRVKRHAGAYGLEMIQPWSAGYP